MRADEIRELTDEELRSRIDDLERDRFNLRFRAATETLEDPLRLRWTRRDVARMKTVLRERALGLNAGEGSAKKTSAPTAAARGRGSRAKRTVSMQKTTARKATARKQSARKTTGSRAGGAKGR
jgi:large subunit ribosomal protein L29